MTPMESFPEALGFSRISADRHEAGDWAMYLHPSGVGVRRSRGKARITLGETPKALSAKDARGLAEALERAVMLADYLERVV